MKKINKVLPMTLLLLTSCATQSPMAIHRDMASEGDCIGIVNNIVNPPSISDVKPFEMVVDYDAAVEDGIAQDVANNFGRRSKSPDEIKQAYKAFLSGNMSLAVLKKLSKEYPAFQGSVSAVIYKDVLKVIHLENKTEGPLNAKSLLEELFKDYEKTFSFRLETEDYFIIDIPVKDPTDATILGEFGEISRIRPLIFTKDGPIPTNRFFEVPHSVILDLNQKVKAKVKRDIDVRYALLGYLDKKVMTYDAFKFLALDYDGKAPADIIFSVYKDSVKAFQKESQKQINNVDTKSPEQIMEESMELIDELHGMYTKMPGTVDSIVYKITIKSPEDLKKVKELYTLAVNGRISLPEK